MSKYRIVEREYCSGQKKFLIQKKGIFKWRDMAYNEICSPTCFFIYPCLTLAVAEMAMDSLLSQTPVDGVEDKIIKREVVG